MSAALAWLLGAVVLFVGTHELLSHPLRAPLVRVTGERGFALLYSVLALGSLYWAVELWKLAPPDRLWEAPDPLRFLAVAVMLVAAILFVGSVSAPNPALMGMPPPAAGGEARGVQAITRHPMMWAFALWAVVHIAVSADSRTIILAGGIAVLALFGAAMQDRKKAKASPGYAAHMARTAFVPFARQLGGRAPLASLWPGPVAVVGGLLLWAAMLLFHPWAVGVMAWPG